MKYLPIVIMCIGLVMVMAGGGQKGLREGGTIVLVIASLIGLAVLFALVVKFAS